MKGIFAIAVLLISASLKAIFDTRTVTVNRVQLSSGKWQYKQSLRIIQLADIHNRRFGKNNKRLFQQLTQLKPDIIFLTGDLIDRNTKSLKHIEKLIQQLSQYHRSIFFVNGNHECENPKKSQLHEVLHHYGVTILQNDHAVWEEQDVNVNIVGVDDAATNQDDLPQALEGLDASHYTILLSHAPNIVWEVEKAHLAPVDLILSGHTHGGQIRMPLIGALLIPEQRFPAKYDQGVFQLDKDTVLYIDSGLGTTRLPIRFFNQSQFTYIEIDSSPSLHL